MRGSRWLKAVLVVGIGVRLVLWCCQSNPAGDDGMRYLTETTNLVDYGVFSTDKSAETGCMPQPDAHDLPLFPLSMAAFYSATHSVRFTQYATGILNILLMLGAVYLLCSILRAKPFCVKEPGLSVGSAVLLFMPDSVIYSLCHMPDMMAVFFVMFGLRSYFRCCYQKSLKNVILFACGFGAAILSKPITIPLFVALALAWFVVLGMAWWKRVACVFVAFALVGLMLCPWLIRNKMAFGEAGLTTISGTNLYSCNWAWLANTFPENEKRQCREEMKAFEESVSGLDKMTRSKKLGDFAKRKIMTHLPSYMAFTFKKHPRLYAGTGTVALLRYLGLDAYCYALDDKWGSGNHAPDKPHVPYSACDVLMACGVQIFAWVCLAAGYLVVAVGCWRIFRCRGLASGAPRVDRLLLWCPILSILLLAAVIGPVTATRYRFIMIPFFSIIAAMSVAPRRDQINEK